MNLSVNLVMIGGNLTRDPEMKYLPSGQPVTDFTVANNEKYTDKDGTKRETTVFVAVKAWGKTAEFAAEQLRKGSPVLIEGRLTQEKWETKTGEKREKTKVTALKVNILEWLTDKDGQPKGGEKAAEPLVVPDKTEEETF